MRHSTKGVRTAVSCGSTDISLLSRIPQQNDVRTEKKTVFALYYTGPEKLSDHCHEEMRAEQPLRHVSRTFSTRLGSGASNRSNPLL